MYKIFHGFALVEAYQNLKKAKRLAENKSVSRFVKLAIAIVVSLVLWCLPIEIFGVEGLTVIEQRLISIFIFATFMWVFRGSSGMDYFCADCSFIVTHCFGQQPMVLRARYSC